MAERWSFVPQSRLGLIKSVGVLGALAVAAIALVLVRFAMPSEPHLHITAIPEGDLDRQVYADAVHNLLARLEKYWNPDSGYYESPVRTSSLTNAMYVQAVSILAGHGMATADQVARAVKVVEKLVSHPVRDEDGLGVSLDMGFRGTSHMSVSGPYCTALAYAHTYADSMSLSASLQVRIVESIAEQLHWLSDQLTGKTGGSNQLAMRWLPEAAAAYALVGHGAEAAEVIIQCMRQVVDHYALTGPGFARPWINPDWTWVYGAHNLQQLSGAQSDFHPVLMRAEYNFTYLSHCAAGGLFSHRVLGGLPEGYAAVLSSMLRVSLGHWAVSGYPLWLSTQLDHRMHSSNYWVWCFYSLVAMSSWPYWDEEYRSTSKLIFDNAIRMVHRLFVVPDEADVSAEMYPVLRRESGSLNRHADLVLSMAAAYTAMAIDFAIDLSSIAVQGPPLTWGFEHAARNLYVSTPLYGAISGNQILQAYYEDRGDITLLYHGNGLMISPAYVQETQLPAQWGISVYQLSPDDRRTEVLATDRYRPDSVTVTVDGVSVSEEPYDTALPSLAFREIRKTSHWLGSGLQATMELAFSESSIFRAFRLSAEASMSEFSMRFVVPARDTVSRISMSTAVGEIVEVSTEAEGVHWTDVRYVHFTYGDYGLVVIPVSDSGGLDRVSVALASPVHWEWDRGRGPSLVIEGDFGSYRSIEIAHIIGFTDGSGAGAEGVYSRLVDEWSKHASDAPEANT